MIGIGGNGEAGRVAHRARIHVRLRPTVLVLRVVAPGKRRGRSRIAAVVVVKRDARVVGVREPALAGERTLARARAEVVAVHVNGKGHPCGQRNRRRHVKSL